MSANLTRGNTLLSQRFTLCTQGFFCGENFEHRRGWVEDKLLTLAEVFCIDVAAYAVMSNHYHVVLHINTQQAEQLSKLTVIERWHQLFKGNLLSQRY